MDREKPRRGAVPRSNPSPTAARGHSAPGTKTTPSPVRSTATSLERKNKDLSKATKELEAKMKNLQQKTRSLPRIQGPGGGLRELPSTPANKEVEKKGSTVTSRVREREAEFQKQVLERDDQIGRLKERLKLLSSKEKIYAHHGRANPA